MRLSARMEGRDRGLDEVLTDLAKVVPSKG